jgi:hypothetical protein
LLLERKRCPNLEEIVLLVIYEWVYKMSWKLFDGCRPMHQCQVQKGKERSQPAVWTLFRSFLLDWLFNSGPAHYWPSTFSPLARGSTEHDPVMLLLL